MFLVRSAREVMDADIQVLPADAVSMSICASPSMQEDCAMSSSLRKAIYSA